MQEYGKESIWSMPGKSLYSKIFNILNLNKNTLTKAY